MVLLLERSAGFYSTTMHLFKSQLLLLGFLQASNGLLTKPDLDTGWRELWTDKSRSETSRTLFHRLKELPLLVDVRVKMADEYIFQASGHIIQNNDLRAYSENISTSGCIERSNRTESMGRSGVMYMYNETVVKILATLQKNNRNYGRCNYTAILPSWNDSDTGGIKSSKFRIRAWQSSSLPKPSFKIDHVRIGWEGQFIRGTQFNSKRLVPRSSMCKMKEDLTIKPNTWHGDTVTPTLPGTSKLSPIQEDVTGPSFSFAHGFGKYPELVISRVRLSTPCRYNGFYVDSLGTTTRGLSPMDTGYVAYRYNKQNISVWTGKGNHVLTGGVGGEVIIDEGDLEIYAWNTKNLKPAIEKDIIDIKPVSISKALGIIMHETMLLGELLNQSLATAEIFLNTYLPIVNLINDSVRLSQLLNDSMIIGEVLDGKAILKLLLLNEPPTLGNAIREIVSPGQLLHGTLTLVPLLHKDIYLDILMEDDLLIISLLNKTLTAEIPINDTMTLNKYLIKSMSSKTLLNDFVISESVTPFQLLNESVKLEDFLNGSLIVSKFLTVTSLTRKLEQYIKDYEQLLEKSTEQVDLLSNSIEDNKEVYSLDTLKKLFKQSEDIRIVVSKSKTVVSQMNESLLISSLMNESVTLFQLLSKTVTFSNLVSSAVSFLPVIAEAEREILGVADSHLVHILNILNTTLTQQFILGELLEETSMQTIDETFQMYQLTRESFPLRQMTLDQVVDDLFSVRQMVDNIGFLEQLFRDSASLLELGQTLHVVKIFLNDSVLDLNIHAQFESIIEASLNDMEDVRMAAADTDTLLLSIESLLSVYKTVNDDITFFSSGTDSFDELFQKSLQMDESLNETLSYWLNIRDSQHEPHNSMHLVSNKAFDERNISLAFLKSFSEYVAEIYNISINSDLLFEGTNDNFLNVSESHLQMFKASLPIKSKLGNVIQTITGQIWFSLLSIWQSTNESFTAQKLVNETIILKRLITDAVMLLKLGQKLIVLETYISASVLHREIYVEVANVSVLRLKDRTDSFLRKMNSTLLIYSAITEGLSQTTETFVEFSEKLSKLNMLINESITFWLLINESVQSGARSDLSILFSELLNETLKVDILLNRSVACLSLFTQSVAETLNVSMETDLIQSFLYVHLLNFSETYMRQLEETMPKEKQIVPLFLALTEQLWTVILSGLQQTNSSSLILQTTFLQMINETKTIRELINGTITLKDMTDNLVTLLDMKNAGNVLWKFLSESLALSDLLNQEGKNVTIKDLIIPSGALRTTVLKPAVEMLLKDDTSLDSTLIRGFAQSIDETNTEWQSIGTAAILWYQHNIIPTLCSFGGFAYGYVEKAVRFWYPNEHPDCATMCPFNLSEEESASVDNATEATAIVKIWHMDENECLRFPCRNGGTCINFYGGYRCACAYGWTGQNCTIDINECDGVTQCKMVNTVECINRFGGYTCQCKQGWTGKNCQFVATPYVVLNEEMPFKESEERSVSEQIEGETDVPQTFVILGTNTFDITILSEITNRYECTRYSVMISGTGQQKQVSLRIIKEAYRWWERESALCKIDWGDGNTTVTNIDKEDVISYHNFTNYGVFRIHISCDDIEGRVYCPEVDTSCVSTNNLLDDFFNNFEAPKRVSGDETIEVNSNNVSFSCGSPRYSWRIVQVSGTQLKPFTDFLQPNSDRLSINPGTMKPGIYVVILEVISRDKSYWLEDSIVLHVILRNLFAYILGGDILYVAHGQKLFINASLSYDPAAEISYVNPSELVVTWTFHNANSSLADKDLHEFLVKQLPSNMEGTCYKVLQGNEYILEVNTSFFPLNSYGIIVFTMSRDTRSSSFLQVIKFVDNILPLRIWCVYNCHPIHGIINYDRLLLDTRLGTGIDKALLTFDWKISEWNGIDFRQIEHDDKSYLSVPKDRLTQGKTYRFSVTVTGSTYVPTKVSVIRTIDYVPYDGRCSLEKTSVTSAYDWVQVTCVSWKTKSLRLKWSRNDTINPILTYFVKQETKDAFIKEDIVTKTSDRQFYVMLKVGDPNDAYKTALIIRIVDIFHNYNEFEITPITSKPVFEVENIDATEAGTELLRHYIQTAYEHSLRSAIEANRPQAVPYFISAVCSNIQLIQITPLPEVFPRLLNEDGAIIDLNERGNVMRLFTDALTQTRKHSPDTTTLLLQDLLRNMTSVMKIITNDDTAQDEQQELVTSNALTNLAAKYEFVTESVMEDIVNMSTQSGKKALNVKDSDKIKRVSGAVFRMTRVVALATVPDTLGQYRSVPDIYNGMQQITDMLNVVGQNINIYNASLSPGERAFIYAMLQRLLFYSNDKTKKNARDAAESMKNRTNEIQMKTDLCDLCTSGEPDKQLLQQGPAAMFLNESTNTKMSSVKLDGLADALGNDSDEQTTVSVSAYELEKNVYMYDNDGISSLVTSSILRVNVDALNKNVIPGHLTFLQKVDSPESKFVVPFVDKEDASECMYHKFLYQRNTENVCIKLEPLSAYNFTEYLVYIKFKGSPTIIDYDIKRSVSENGRWNTCLNPKEMKGHTGVTYIGVRLNEIQRVTNYSITIATMACLTWEERASRWNTDKCTLKEWLHEEAKISCFCNEITDMVFGNSFFVAPNSIDFSAVFLKFSPLNQAAVLGTLAGIFVIYVVSIVLLSRLDRRDKLKWGITPLRDNLIDNTQYYMIKVTTGLRHGAGTRSRVAFILSGECGHTGPREMFDGVRQEFSTGSVMSFLMATSVDLGDLKSLQIWHDDSGEDDYGSWYLNQVDVYDVKRQKTYSFVAERWLSLETGIEARLSSSPTDRPLKFESRFFYHIRDRLSDGHMLVSILYRPQMSTFTRVQRVSCAVVFIMLNIIANAMYFDPEPNYESEALLQVGPFRFTSQQIYISLMCAVMTTLPTMFLVFLFKRTKPTPEGSSTISTCLCNYSCACPKRKPSNPNKQKEYEESLKSLIISPEVPAFQGGIYFPHFFVYFAWLIVWGGIAAPSFFVLLFSMEWGKKKSEEWLTAMLMSLLESMILVDPFAVICVSFLLAVFVCIDSKEAMFDVKQTIRNYRRSLGKTEDTVSSSVSMLRSLVKEFQSYVSSPRMVTPPLKGDKLKHAAEKHRQHKKFIEIVGDLQVNIILVLVVSVICYANRDNRSYFHHSETVNAIVEPRGTPGFHKIKTPGDLYSWLNFTLIPHLFAEKDEIGTLLNWKDRQFTKDYIHFRLGPPRLRQLRTKHDTCDLPYFGHISCYGKYIALKEEEMNYCLGWKARPCSLYETTFNVSTSAWLFTSALDIWGLPLPGYYTTYGGGGYIASLDVNLNSSIDIVNELYRNMWIDRQTRAVIVEFTLYEAATNIFTYNIFMIEFPETSGAFTSFSIYPMKLYTHHGPMGTLILICEVCFVIYLVVMLCKTCVRIYRQRCQYFVSLWRVFDLLLFVVGVLAIALFAMRLCFSIETIESFKRNKKLFVNFSHIVFWDQALVSVLGVLAFMTTMRLLEAYATLNKLKAIVEIFRECGKELFWHGLAFFQTFMGFCVFAWFLFGSALNSYRNIYQCMATLFIAMIGKSKFTEINDRQPVLAKIFFVTYIFVVVYFILTIFLSILGASVDNVVHKSRVNSDGDLMKYMMGKLQAFFYKPGNNRTVGSVPSEAPGSLFTMTAKERLLNRRRSCYVRPHTGPCLDYVRNEPTQEEVAAGINNKRIPKKRRQKNQPIFTTI